MENNFKIGDSVYVIADAKYLNDKKVPDILYNTPLYIRAIEGEECTIAKKMQGPVLGKININNLKLIEIANIKPYIIQILSNNTPIYHSPNKNSGIIKRFERFFLFTVIDEKNGFGKIQNTNGWIELDKVKKVVEL